MIWLIPERNRDDVSDSEISVLDVEQSESSAVEEMIKTTIFQSREESRLIRCRSFEDFEATFMLPDGFQPFNDDNRPAESLVDAYISRENEIIE